jgi:mannose-1-phosphate guanylyltransferase
LYIVLMAGGVGTRFWPMSRKANPKQLLQIVGSKTMLRLTYERIKTLTDANRILVITGKNLKKAIEQELPEIPAGNIIPEPMGKNTAPCIGLAAALIAANGDSEEPMVVLPADHLVSEKRNFQNTVKLAVQYASTSGCLLTIGIKPTYPETGYGYIQLGKELFSKGKRKIYEVRTFAEKPNLETAERFLRSGDFVWNSGMFIWRTDAILNEIDEHLPELREDLYKVEKAAHKKTFTRTLSDVYSRTKAISIDYGVMEIARNVCVVKADFKWNDLGSWEAVYNISPKDKNLNVIHAKGGLSIDSKNNYLYSKGKLIATVGVENIIVVDMDDAILICRKEHSQSVKELVENLSRKGMNDYL